MDKKEIIGKLQLLENEYKHLLEDERQELVLFATAHGWKSSRYEKGKELREAIDALSPVDETQTLNENGRRNCPTCGRDSLITLSDITYCMNDGCEGIKNDTSKVTVSNDELLERAKEETVEQLAIKWYQTANKHKIMFDLGWIEIFKAGYATSQLSKEEDAVGLLNFLQDEHIVHVTEDGEAWKDRIILTDAGFYWSKDYDGDQPISSNEVIKLYNIYKLNK